jgi:hypothetical protein
MLALRNTTGIESSITSLTKLLKKKRDEIKSRIQQVMSITSLVTPSPSSSPSPLKLPRVVYDVQSNTFVGFTSHLENDLPAVNAFSAESFAELKACADGPFFADAPSYQFHVNDNAFAVIIPEVSFARCI